MTDGARLDISMTEREAIAKLAREVMKSHVGALVDDEYFASIELELAEMTGLPSLCDKRCNPLTATKVGRVQAFVFLPDGEFVRVVIRAGAEKAAKERG